MEPQKNLKSQKQFLTKKSNIAISDFKICYRVIVKKKKLHDTGIKQTQR